MKGLAALSSPGVAPINSQWKRVRRKESKSPRPPLDPHVQHTPFAHSCVPPLLSLLLRSVVPVRVQLVNRVSVFILPRRSRICPSPAHPRATRFFVPFSSSQISTYHPTSFSNPPSTGTRQPLAGQSHNHLKIRLSHETGTSSSASKSHWPGDFAKIMNRA